MCHVSVGPAALFAAGRPTKLLCAACVFAALLSAGAPTGAHAQSVFENLKERAAGVAEQAGAAAGEAARAVGEAGAKAVDTVGEVGAKAVDNVKTTAEETTADLGDAESAAATRAKLDVMAEQTIDRLLTERPDVAPLLGASYGYAVFDTRQVKLGIAGGYGRGVAVNNETGARTYMRMGSAGVGVRLGFGGFDTQFVILFETPFAYNKFVTQGLDATAEASSMVGEEYDRMALGFEDGRAVFVLTKQGWKVSAGLTGSRYWPDEKLNAPES